MKYKGFFYVTICLAAVILVSCRKETSIESGTQPPGEFIARIDKIAWAAAASAQGVSFDQGVATITGVSADNLRLNMIIYDTVVGVYTLNQQSPSLATYSDLDSAAVYAYSTNQGYNSSQAGGTVKITQVNPVYQTISGTFAFNVYRDFDGAQVTIDSGVFNNLHYTRAAASANADTMRASIDNVAWVGQGVEAADLGGILGLTGSAPEGLKMIALQLPASSVPGTYSLDFMGFNGLFGLYNPTASEILYSSTGSLTILENDTVRFRIRGNFAFEASDLLSGITAHDITNGYFSVYYGQ